MIPYVHALRPFLAHDAARGLECPVCGMSLLLMPVRIRGEADGSATAPCPKCNAPLRQNPEGFVFLDQR